MSKSDRRFGPKRSSRTKSAEEAWASETQPARPCSSPTARGRSEVGLRPGNACAPKARATSRAARAEVESLEGPGLDLLTTTGQQADPVLLGCGSGAEIDPHAIGIDEVRTRDAGAL